GIIRRLPWRTESRLRDPVLASRRLDPALVKHPSNHSVVVAIEAMAIALAFLAVLAFFRSYADDTVGGADSYGYLSEAIRLSHGHFYAPEHVLSRFGLPENSAITHPLGYIEKGSVGTVPTYPFGYPLLMLAAMEITGMAGAYWVTPILGAATIVLTYLLARDYLGRVGGGVAAGLTLALPNFLMFAAQPMSDVPAAFCGTLALFALLRKHQTTVNDLVLAVAMGLGIWIRPNLALLVIPILGWLLWRREFPRAVRFAALLAPFVVVEGAVNAHLYGAPWTTGYGDPPFTRSVTDASRRFGRYLLRLNTQQAGVGLALAGFGLAFGKLSWRVRVFLIGFAGFLLLFFSFYSIDDAWWYGRFLLPGLTPVAIVEASGIVWLLDLRPRRWVPLSGLVVGAALFGWQTVGFDRANFVFTLGQGDLKYREAAQFVARSVAEPALVLAGQHSGSLRLYAGIETMRDDLAPVPELMATLQRVTATGGAVYLVVEDWEVQRIRSGDRAVLLAGAQDLGSVEPGHVTLFRLNVLAAGDSPVPHPLDATFGNQIALRGFDVSPLAPKPGDVLTVTLYWTARRKPDVNYSVFVHLERSDGKIVGQSDSYPMAGRYPTSTWTPGYTVRDVHRIVIPATAPSEPVQVTVGLYRLDTLQRLPPSGRSVRGNDTFVDLTTLDLAGP
ncbi:MAG: ArnT family glycosyltransferase, partial [Chloroflexota bacterium]